MAGAIKLTRVLRSRYGYSYFTRVALYIPFAIIHYHKLCTESHIRSYPKYRMAKLEKAFIGISMIL